MKIRERIEFYLAKIAGIEVDMENITPHKASSTVEELLDKIAERVDDIDDAATADPEAATTTKAGVVKMAANVAAAAGTEPTAAEFKALLDALIAAGLMAPNA